MGNPGASPTAQRGEHLPPLRGGSALPSKLGPGLLARGGSWDCGAALAAECSEGPLSVQRSALSGSSKAPFPPNRVFANDFQWTRGSRDLPPEVRPIIEDNKMMQEELRRYRGRVGEQEGIIASQERKLTALRDELLRERQRLKECSGVTPEQLLQDREFRRTLQDRDATIRQLQQKADVLEHAKQACERRLGNDLAMERRQQGELRRQLKQLQEEMAEKQKAARFNQLHINQLYRRLEPLEAAVAAAAAAATPPPPPPLPPEPEEQVQLMLCMVYAQPQPSAAEIAEAAARLAAAEAAKRAAELALRQATAVVPIQAAARGWLARRQLAAQHQAATTIQAAVRGMLARRALALLWQQQLAEAEACAGSEALTPAERLALRRQAAERQYRDRTAGRGGRARSRLPVRPTSRTANTAPEAAARKRAAMHVHGGVGSSGSSSRGGSSSSSPVPGRAGAQGGDAVRLPPRPSAAGEVAGGSGGSHIQRGSAMAASMSGGGNAGSSGSSPTRRASTLAGSSVTAANTSGSAGSPTRRGSTLAGPTASTGSASGNGGEGSPARRASARMSVSGVPRLDLHAQEQGRSPGRGGRGPLLGKQPVQLGFASSQPRRSVVGGLMV